MEGEGGVEDHDYVEEQEGGVVLRPEIVVRIVYSRQPAAMLRSGVFSDGGSPFLVLGPVSGKCVCSIRFVEVSAWSRWCSICILNSSIVIVNPLIFHHDKIVCGAWRVFSYFHKIFSWFLFPLLFVQSLPSISKKKSCLLLSSSSSDHHASSPRGPHAAPADKQDRRPVPAPSEEHVGILICIPICIPLHDPLLVPSIGPPASPPNMGETPTSPPPTPLFRGSPHRVARGPRAEPLRDRY